MSDDRQHLIFSDVINIIFLQETHWTQEKHLSIQQEWKGTILFNDGTDSACGVAILFSKKLDLKSKHVKRDSHGRTLAIIQSKTFVSCSGNIIKV